MPYLTHRPAAGRITEAFGPRPKPTPTSPAIHYGQDYGWGGGDTIRAARAGRVKAYAYSGAYGNRLIIDHGDGRETWYCHLAYNLAAVGDQVDAGDDVAVMGATGNVTGKHLHFELRIDGRAVDPEPYFTDSATAGLDSTPINLEGDDDMPLRIYSNTDEGGAVYLFSDTGWQHIADPEEARNLTAMLTGKEQAPKAFGGQINMLKRRVERFGRMLKE